MSNIFEIIPGIKESKDSPPTFSLGIKLKISHYETICSVTQLLSHDELQAEINLLKNELADIQEKLKSSNEEKISQSVLGIDDDSSPREIWEALSTLADNMLFLERFNSLSEFKRREMADYIFANCNMFTGKGAYFSARYVQETGLLTV